MQRYMKLITAEVTGLIGWGLQVVTSPSVAITGGEWIALATIIAMGLGVYSATNTPAV